MITKLRMGIGHSRDYMRRVRIVTYLAHEIPPLGNLQPFATVHPSLPTSSRQMSVGFFRRYGLATNQGPCIVLLRKSQPCLPLGLCSEELAGPLSNDVVLKEVNARGPKRYEMGIVVWRGVACLAWTGLGRNDAG
ncbi:hypothetical protein VFPPC_17944 [Pochonia chlamydosporia 170]|uniref:Uncharacterized protein n=1 Tax=Pochonia chlamydosporia 170 TaxID=1380566 RepID=A0A219APZ8_METCM|nr:hypothetical protein VFPPC_17944 [Pochonia chlamydosporia 170]OWT42863.1 hypothetical protein VFPPC_17944 [Pochonia chlamydosporia 170]